MRLRTRPPLLTYFTYPIGNFCRTDWLYSALSFGYDRGFPGPLNAQ